MQSCRQQQLVTENPRLEEQTGKRSKSNESALNLMMPSKGSASQGLRGKRDAMLLRCCCEIFARHFRFLNLDSVFFLWHFPNHTVCLLCSWTAVCGIVIALSWQPILWGLSSVVSYVSVRKACVCVRACVLCVRIHGRRIACTPELTHLVWQFLHMFPMSFSAG